jgi:hypothetical protein
MYLDYILSITKQIANNDFRGTSIMSRGILYNDIIKDDLELMRQQYQVLVLPSQEILVADIQSSLNMNI